MTGYTPTTDEVRINTVADITSSHPLYAERLAQFDRWRADFKRKIAAEALRDAARSIPSGEMWPESSNPVHFAQRLLLTRADRIEQGGES